MGTDSMHTKKCWVIFITQLLGGGLLGIDFAQHWVDATQIGLNITQLLVYRFTQHLGYL